MVLSRYVGADVKRKEDPRLITGSSLYVDDLQLPGMVHVAIVRSPYPHAKIKGIDFSAAKAMPGVLLTLSGDDLAEFCGPIGAMAHAEGDPGKVQHVEEITASMISAPDVWAVARDRARNVGEAVAVVVAESRYQAEDAAAAVDDASEPVDDTFARWREEAEAERDAKAIERERRHAEARREQEAAEAAVRAEPVVAATAGAELAAALSALGAGSGSGGGAGGGAESGAKASMKCLGGEAPA